MSINSSVIISVFVIWQIAFILAAVKRRNDIADVLWGLTFVFASWVAVYVRSRHTELPLGLGDWVPLAAVSFWGLRLAYHIGTRWLSHDKEDIRYNNWRKEWGSTWLWRTYLQIFVLQPILALLIVWPMVRALNFAPRDLSPLVLLGAAVWIFGFVFESVGDSQLRAFLKVPANKGKIMDQGLWSWSRHPNYFGEVVQWWGVYFMCIEPGGWWLVFSPIVITFFILKISGVTMLEDLMRSRPGFKEYAERTSAFVPMPPKKKVGA
jgi:steroid 5-alpha reductase family enzyme